MPKMKTHRGAKKRMYVSGGGVIRRRRAGKRHKLEVKSAKRRKRLRQPSIVSGADLKRAKKLLPYR